MKIGLRLAFVCITICTSFLLWLSLDRKVTVKEEQKEETKETPTKTPEEVTQQIVHMTRSNGETLELPLETYLQGVIGSEMPASFEIEALKAQAVAARTFACKRNYEVDDTTASQVYHDEEQLKDIWKENYEEYAARIKEVVNATEGEILTYEGECITAAFFSSSNGKTNNVEDYWTTPLPYLRSVDSPWDTKEEGNVQSVTYTKDEFASLLGFQNPIQEISDIAYYDNDYVKSITVDGIIFSGREMREALKLRSSSFEISQEEDTYVITTHGYGHGIGLSQYGAQAMAKDGSDYKSILHHYYSDVELEKL